MALTQAQQKLNEEILRLEIGDRLLQLYFYDLAMSEKLEHLLSFVREVLDQREILLGIPAGNLLLETLLKDTLSEMFGEDHFDQESFTQKLNNWADYYQALSLSSTQDLQKLVAKQAPSIARSLMDYGVVPEKAWGDEVDISLVLRDVISHPNDIKGSGTYVLPPTMIAPGPVDAYASSEEINQPHLFIKDHLKTVIEQNKDQDILLVVPVNSGYGHWRVAQVKLDHGSISQASLWDSIAQETLEETPAYINLQTAVNEINSEAHTDSVVVIPDASGIQTNDFQCALFTTQRIVQALPEDEVQAAGLENICDATPDNIHRAFIAKVIEHHPVLSMRQQQEDVPVHEEEQDQVSRIFTEQEEVTEDSLHTKLKGQQDEEEEKAKERILLQVRFDALLAKNLGELEQQRFESGEQIEQIEDDILFAQAWKSTFITFKNHYTFFQPKRDLEGSNLTVSVNMRNVL